MKTLLKSSIIAGFVALTALGTVTAASAHGGGFGRQNYGYTDCRHHDRDGRYRHEGWMKGDRFDRMDRFNHSDRFDRHGNDGERR